MTEVLRALCSASLAGGRLGPVWGVLDTVDKATVNSATCDDRSTAFRATLLFWL